jgi:hypothetical protein
MELESSLPCSHVKCRILIFYIFKNVQFFLRLYLDRMRNISVATARNVYKLFRLKNMIPQGILNAVSQYLSL